MKKSAYNEETYKRLKQRELERRKEINLNIYINFSRLADGETVEFLESLDEPKATYIKRLIRDDIAKQKKRRGQK